MTDLDLSKEHKYLSNKMLAGLGVPEEFIVGDREYSKVHLFYEHNIKKAQRYVWKKALDIPNQPRARSYRRSVSKNAKRDFQHRQRRWLWFARLAGRGRDIRAVSEAAWAIRHSQMFSPPLQVVPPPRTARERRWRKYHKTEPFPWETP